MVFFVAQQSHALGLGEIQINSYLGEPLSAQVDLTELGADYESSVKVRLASPEEYKKGGYTYPYDKKFKFIVFNADGKHPRVRITSLYPIEDPFLNLMMEVASPSGRIIKTFTFLVDPTPDFFRTQTAAPTIVQSSASASSTKQAVAVKTVEPVIQTPAAAMTSTVPVQQTKRHKVRSAASVHRGQLVSEQRSRHVGKLDSGEQVSGKLSLSLSTSLSISSSDPSLPLNARENSDALQEELIAKEKTLKDLHSQIAEMQTLIKGLQIKLSMTAGSAVTESGVMAVGESAVVSVSAVDSASSVVSQVQVAPVVRVPAPVVVPPASAQDSLLAWLAAHGRALLAGLAIIVLGGVAYYWRRKRKLESGWIPGGLFDDLASSPEQEVKQAEAVVATPVATNEGVDKVATKKLSIGEQSMKVPAFKVQKTLSTLPPEYDLLEEANIYLRFGHDKLAEEVLRDALKINPSNPDTYMTLLGIFDTRADAQGFEKTAKEFKMVADQETWNKVADMGRKLDIGNTLYAKPTQ
jgi:pilus assembly protein FimV